MFQKPFFLPQNLPEGEGQERIVRGSGKSLFYLVVLTDFARIRKIEEFEPGLDLGTLSRPTTLAQRKGRTHNRLFLTGLRAPIDATFEHKKAEKDAPHSFIGGRRHLGNVKRAASYFYDRLPGAFFSSVSSPARHHLPIFAAAKAGSG